jgi:hypothetical protein
MNEEEKKPRLKLLESGISFELCNPLKEKINQIEICGPYIEVKSPSITGSHGCGPWVSKDCRPTLPCAPDGRNWDERDWAILYERMAAQAAITNLSLKETDELRQQVKKLKTDIEELKQQAKKQFH